MYVPRQFFLFLYDAKNKYIKIFLGGGVLNRIVPMR